MKKFSEKQNPFLKTSTVFLVESTKIESVTFPYKASLSGGNAKTNRTEVESGPIRKNGILLNNYRFVFFFNF